MKTKPAIYLLTLALTVSPLWAAPFEFSIQHVTPPRGPASPNSGPAVFPDEFRSIDGSGNTRSIRRAARPTRRLFATRQTLTLMAQACRRAAISERERDQQPRGSARSSHSQRGKRLHFLWQWGQFIDHDMDLTPSIDPAEPFDVPVPAGDPFFDPNNTGTQFIELDRSFYEMINGVREQMNIDTAYIDASQVYGSDEARAQELRRLDGSGKLKTSAGNLLPYNIHGFPNVPTTDATFFLAGDLRSNEPLGLTAMHTLFVREHNFWADVFHAAQPN